MKKINVVLCDLWVSIVPEKLENIAEKLVHAFISSRLDYCNSLFYGITGKNIQNIQRCQDPDEGPEIWAHNTDNTLTTLAPCLFPDSAKFLYSPIHA